MADTHRLGSRTTPAPPGRSPRLVSTPYNALPAYRDVVPADKARPTDAYSSRGWSTPGQDEHVR